MSTNERKYLGLTYLNLSALSSEIAGNNSLLRKQVLSLSKMALVESQHDFMGTCLHPISKEDEDEEELERVGTILVYSYYNVGAAEEYLGFYD